VIRADLSLASFQNKLDAAAKQMLGNSQEKAHQMTGANLYDRRTIAVLPFKNNSLNEDDNFFAIGLTEELVYDLQRLRLFSIISAESTMQYGTGDVDSKAVARDLNADFIISGAVRLGGNRIRINAKLIDSRTGLELWSNRFEGTDEDIFTLQDTIAFEIVGAIEPEIISHESKRVARVPTSDLMAWDLFLKGQAEFHKLSYEGLITAREYCERAHDADESFAQPLAGLAAVHFYLLMLFRSHLTDQEAA
jgi:TolB-like protein